MDTGVGVCVCMYVCNSELYSVVTRCIKKSNISYYQSKTFL
jgi:hypothetical protein